MIALLSEVATIVLRQLASAWLDSSYAATWRDKEEQALKTLEPIFAELVRAAAGEGLAGFILSASMPGDAATVRKIWELRQPFDNRMVLAMAELNLYQKGNPSA